jgi:hypothetical protein
VDGAGVRGLCEPWACAAGPSIAPAVPPPASELTCNAHGATPSVGTGHCDCHGDAAHCMSRGHGDAVTYMHIHHACACMLCYMSVGSGH